MLHTSTDGGPTGNQGPLHSSHLSTAPAQSAGLPPPLLKANDFRALLGGMGERRFAQLLAEGVIQPPLELGPRSPRWTHDDYLLTVQRLTRRERKAEPATLAEGRRARIDRLKAAEA
jgi:hypothetical protein